MSLILEPLTSIVATMDTSISGSAPETTSRFVKISRFNQEQNSITETSVLTGTDDTTLVQEPPVNVTSIRVKLMSVANVSDAEFVLTVSSKIAGVKTVLDTVTLPVGSTWHFDEDAGYYLNPTPVAATESMSTLEEINEAILHEIRITNRLLSIITGI